MKEQNTIRAKDRILFNDHNTVREARIVEVSPSRKHMKLSYLYRDTAMGEWVKTGTLIEVLGEAP